MSGQSAWLIVSVLFGVSSASIVLLIFKQKELKNRQFYTEQFFDRVEAIIDLPPGSFPKPLIEFLVVMAGNIRSKKFLRAIVTRMESEPYAPNAASSNFAQALQDLPEEQFERFCDTVFYFAMALSYVHTELGWRFRRKLTVSKQTTTQATMDVIETSGNDPHMDGGLVPA
ncbi:MAG: hypothetical protein MI755_23340 [Sphingomonadales bacterium]|nr:hypothetical protein [Sphingomonadales bacterium]